MAKAASSADGPLRGPITMGEFRARLAEMTDRVLAGEEVVVLRGSEPVARFVPMEVRRKKRLGTLNDLLSEADLARLDATIAAPLSNADQHALEGEGTNEVGVWVGRADEEAASRD